MRIGSISEKLVYFYFQKIVNCNTIFLLGYRSLNKLVHFKFGITFLIHFSDIISKMQDKSFTVIILVYCWPTTDKMCLYK